jgi:hypothetical protein
MKSTVCLGASPQTPRVGFAEFWAKNSFCSTWLCFLLLDRVFHQIPESLLRVLNLVQIELNLAQHAFCEAELRFLLLFLEKEEPR